MIALEGEITIWESKNKRYLLTTHRIREMRHSIFGSTIKSVMLENLTACELGTVREFKYLRKALLSILLLNGSVFLLNRFLFKAELIKYFFGEIHIHAAQATAVFYISIGLALIFIGMFIFSYRKVFSFHSIGMSIFFELRRLDFNERESFISKVEQAKLNRLAAKNC